VEGLPRADRKALKTDRKISGPAVYCIGEDDGRIVHNGSKKFSIFSVNS
jgi:hypothetical protein